MRLGSPRGVSYTIEHRDAGGDVLHEVVRRGLPVFEARLRHEDRHIPHDVQRELDACLGCGDVTLGFGWLACLGCDHQRLLASSCKKRSFCLSCMARRMAQRSAAWVDGLLPYRPVRQWVLTVPFRRRWQFARHHRLAKGVLRETIDALQEHDARRAGGGTTGSVTIVQRASNVD